MINAIVAIDAKRGIADDRGIPWDLPTDQAYFKQKTGTGSILMGFRTYQTFKKPLPDRRNLVQVRPGTELREGFIPVDDVDSLITAYQDAADTLWIIGGVKLFEYSLPHVQQLYITHVQGDFKCTKFFPEYKDHFELIHQEPTLQENGHKFRFEIWHSNAV